MATKKRSRSQRVKLPEMIIFSPPPSNVPLSLDEAVRSVEEGRGGGTIEKIVCEVRSKARKKSVQTYRQNQQEIERQRSLRSSYHI